MSDTGGMPSSGNEIPDEAISKMMSGGGGSSSAQPNAAQMAQMMTQMGGAAHNPLANEAGKAHGAGGQQPHQAQPVQPREVGSVVDELKLGASDIFSQLKDFFSLNSWLGVDPNNLNPEQKAHAQQVHSRYQQLDQEQQAVARQMYQERMQRKRQQQQEDEHKRQVEAQQKAQSVEMPSSPKKGAQQQGGNKKQRTMQKLKTDRTTLNNTQGE